MHETQQGKGLLRGPVRDVLRELAVSVAAVVLALLLGALLLAAAGYDVRDAYYNLYDGAFGSVYSIADTLLNSIPLIFAGLAIAFAFRGGLFNIGAEGQLYVGALATAVTALALADWPAVPLITAALLAGALAAACGDSSPACSKRKQAPTKSLRQLCSTTSRRY